MNLANSINGKSAGRYALFFFLLTATCICSHVSATPNRRNTAHMPKHGNHAPSRFDPQPSAQDQLSPSTRSQERWTRGPTRFALETAIGIITPSLLAHVSETTATLHGPVCAFAQDSLGQSRPERSTQQDRPISREQLFDGLQKTLRAALKDSNAAQSEDKTQKDLEAELGLAVKETLKPRGRDRGLDMTSYLKIPATLEKGTQNELRLFLYTHEAHSSGSKDRYSIGIEVYVTKSHADRLGIKLPDIAKEGGPAQIFFYDTGERTGFDAHVESPEPFLAAAGSLAANDAEKLFLDAITNGELEFKPAHTSFLRSLVPIAEGLENDVIRKTVKQLAEKAGVAE